MGSSIDSSPWKLPRPTGSEQVSGEAVGPSLQVTARANGAQRPIRTPATSAQEPTLPPRATLYATIPERLFSASRALVRRPPIICICNDPQCCPETSLAHDKQQTLSCPTRVPGSKVVTQVGTAFQQNHLMLKRHCRSCHIGSGQSTTLCLTRTATSRPSASFLDIPCTRNRTSIVEASPSRK